MWKGAPSTAQYRPTLKHWGPLHNFLKISLFHHVHNDETKMKNKTGSVDKCFDPDATSERNPAVYLLFPMNLQ